MHYLAAVIALCLILGLGLWSGRRSRKSQKNRPVKLYRLRKGRRGNLRRVK
ncbi:hypothetical protein CEB3_c45250 [Peptococcaceae bacterium CEB3]|nr:hypothetical protein CEB3_c45250 [Peptococcaceae bacterium CEB3]